MSLLRDFHAARARNNAPVTTAIVVLMVAGFLGCWLDTSFRVLNALLFHTSEVWSQPWGLVTYPFAENGIVSLLFACLWLWGVGGVVEREEGALRFGAFWVAMSALCAVGLWVGSLVTGVDALFISAWTPIAAVTVVWGTRNPETLVQLMLVLPIKGKWMAWLSVVLVFFGTRNLALGYAPQLAPFAAAPLVLAWMFATKKLLATESSATGGKSRFVRGAGFYSREYFDEVKRRERQREEKERLKKLFEGEGSGEENPPDN
ncbi:MAG: hypothetical protein A2139_03705 [Desulfobacca sp. RBG_16_60_12]|nr:MAG: hypothetical protein A2139_03705 [Desulfobacca sp. RBG_16_60_12]